MYATPKISIIIPAFNSESYIGETLDCVLKQNINSIEVIVIDDGSTDSTTDIVNRYIEKDSRVHLYLQNHKGSGLARNLGISRSTGKYLAFMDSDDFYPTDDVLSYLYSKAESSKCPMCGGSLGYLKNNEVVVDFDRVSRMHTPKSVNRKEGIYSSKDFQCELFYVRFLFLREFIINNNIMFPDLLRGQDMVFMANAMLLAQKIYCCPKTVYIYRNNHKTIAWDHKKLRDMIKAEELLISLGNKNKFPYIIVRSLARLTRMYYLYYFGLNITNNLRRQLNRTINSAKNSLLKGINVKLWKKYHFLDYKENCFDEIFSDLKNNHIEEVFIYCANDIGWYVYNKLKILNFKVNCIFDRNASLYFSQKANCPIKTFDRCRIDISKKIAFIVSSALYFEEISCFINNNLEGCDITIYQASSFPPQKNLSDIE